ncbi:MAG TPA: SsrA-binding protein SmpB [Candidatus Polarisedimenticolia bacterium]|nr:SsrA-binding protein SmpB [Candidatus Polarisedimenticolia bacterium]
MVPGEGVKERARERALAMSRADASSGEKVLASNRQAFHNYFVGDRFEAGIALLGTEVKSLRDGKANLKDAFARVQGGEVFLHNCHISPYSHGGYANHDPLRPRKLLLHRDEIRRLSQKTTLGGQTLIPLRLYLIKGRVKVEIALARGKKLWDKRQAIKEKDQEKQARAAVRERRG